LKWFVDRRFLNVRAQLADRHGSCDDHECARPPDRRMHWVVRPVTRLACASPAPARPAGDACVMGTPFPKAAAPTAARAVTLPRAACSVLACLLLQAAACTARDSFPATILLGPNRNFIFVSSQPSGIIERHYGQGDRLTIDFREGVFTINGIPYSPQSDPPPTEYPIEYIERHYGQVPMIRRLLGSDTASITRLNSALRDWGVAYRKVLRDAGDEYRRHLSEGRSPHDAEALVLDSVRADSLIAWAERDGAPPDSATRRLVLVTPKGGSREGLHLSADPPLRPRTREDRFTEKEARAQLRSLQHLLGGSDSAHVLVEYRLGGVHLASHP
jgi:hypothetical protein